MTVLFNIVEHQILLMFIYFTLQSDDMNEEKQSPVRQVNTLKDISIQNLVIREPEEKRYLTQVTEINTLQQKIIFQFYKPPFPHPSYFFIFTKMGKTSNADW